MKLIVLHTAESGAYSKLEEVANALKDSSNSVLFPERRGHPDDCINEILDALEMKPVLFVVTAYADAINFVLAAVEEGLLSPNTAVYLHRVEGSPTIHQTVDGYLKDWPFGCLMPDSDVHMARLKDMVTAELVAAYTTEAAAQKSVIDEVCQFLTDIGQDWCREQVERKFNGR